MNEIINDLAYARHACEQCLSKDGVLVDMHGLAYWAGEVERLRNEIKSQLQRGAKMYKTFIDYRTKGKVYYYEGNDIIKAMRVQAELLKQYKNNNDIVAIGYEI